LETMVIPVSEQDY